MRAAYGPLIKN